MHVLKENSDYISWGFYELGKNPPVLVISPVYMWSFLLIIDYKAKKNKKT